LDYFLWGNSQRICTSRQLPFQTVILGGAVYLQDDGLKKHEDIIVADWFAGFFKARGFWQLRKIFVRNTYKKKLGAKKQVERKPKIKHCDTVHHTFSEVSYIV